jgi:hypothetical protein
MGGTAYLSLLSSQDEPFLTGISFTAMPPAKRWRQMEALSGGEKVTTLPDPPSPPPPTQPLSLLYDSMFVSHILSPDIDFN